MREDLFFLVVFASMLILLAVFAVIGNHVSVENASLLSIVTYALGAALLVGWTKRRKSMAHKEESSEPSSTVLWLIAPFAASAFVALLQSMRKKWDIGDIIGLSGFTLFAALVIYGSLRRKRDAK